MKGVTINNGTKILMNNQVYTVAAVVMYRL